jgi:hypothetical protein
MSYSSFTNLEIKEKFGVEQVYRDGLFADVPPCEVSDLLTQNLEEGVPFALLQGSEKARSEFIIAPIFMELRRQAKNQISIFSGVEFTVEIEQGLNGFCDFLISRSSFQSDVEAPVMVAVEAKQDDFRKGMTQCIAEMIAARLFNERRKKDIKEVYGTVTTGDVWRFVVLRGNQAIIETESFDVRENLNEIVGILLAMATNKIE